MTRKNTTRTAATPRGVFGNAGGESRMTMTFNALRNGDGWRGRWLRFEQCAVLLRPLNGDSHVHLP